MPPDYYLLLLTSAIFFLFAHLVTQKNQQSRHSLLSRIVLTTAGVSYLAMAGIAAADPKVPLYFVRYADWFITVPIMTWQLVSLMGVRHGASYLASVGSAFVMLGLGLAGELGFWHREWLGAISTIFFLYIFISLSNHMTRQNAKIFLGQALIWSFYGIAYFTPTKEGIIAFCCADLAAKVSLAVTANRNRGSKNAA